MNYDLLAVSADAKTVKGESKGFLTGILYLAPHTLSGFQTCPKATTGCMFSCLNTAGRGAMGRVQRARIKKTKDFFLDRNAFLKNLVENIKKLKKQAEKRGLTPCVRLNGTSDLAWEKFKIDNKNIFEHFPEIQFYDYTKILDRKSAKSIPNYHLTFSLSENNDHEAIVALQSGMNVAVVVHGKKNQAKPNMFSGFPAIDGDLDDIRFIDKTGVVVLLRAKGRARRDTVGFVKNLDYQFNAEGIDNRRKAA